LETVSLEWIQDERATGGELNTDTASLVGIAAQTSIDPAAQRRSSSDTAILPKESGLSRSEELEAFLDGLRRGQEEQERLEKGMESERLNEELNLLHYQPLRPRNRIDHKFYKFGHCQPVVTSQRNQYIETPTTYQHRVVEPIIPNLQCRMCEIDYSNEVSGIYQAVSS
jgi:hypothetical protein